MRKYAAISAVLHLAVITIAWFGLPDLFRPNPPEDKPLIVEVLPISQITNAPPPKPEPPKVAEAPKPPEPKPEPPKPEPPKVVEQPKPEPPKPPEPKPAPPPPAAAPPPPPPAPAPAPRAEAPLPPPPKPRPEPPKPQREPQPQVAKAEPAQKQPKQQQFDLDNMLKDLTRRRPQPAAPAPAPAPQQAQAAPRAASNAPHNPLIPLSMTEEDAIRQKISQNWLVDVGAKGVETFVVELRLWVLSDGTVRDARVESTDRMGDESYRAFAESARRAALRSSPLPLPSDKVGQLTNGNLVLVFRARDMLGIRG